MKLLMLEVAASNNESVKIKQKRLYEEKALEAEIIEYNKQKVLREERKAKEAAILREEKQREL